ncbi:rhomboid family intramembrane serine protease [Halioxenophilus sp. WMMB6]|uniref:rhomboid family intramembrane serine protease n=1 Tax=Halioxenophilus sp. WMMB6 TaxID=3073815 RepID=UPI00295ECAB8|nr:rhomboid family intramembrane serine protease [Halioxenophilus sp. WMMB6]
MSGWFVCAQFPVELDLSQVNRVLQERGIEHRFTEEKGYQWLWLFNSQDRVEVVELLRQWQQGPVELQNPDFAEAAPSAGLGNQIFLAFLSAPVTTALILLGLVGTLLVHLAKHQGAIPWISWLFFFPVEYHPPYMSVGSAKEAILAGQVWRLITPTFLHFDTMHITFNALWIWIFGRRIELCLGSRTLLVISLIIAIAANVVQGVWGEPRPFGGLSGVVYGLLGFIWVWQILHRDSSLNIPTGIVIFMLVSLLLGLAGVLDLFASGGIAHGAHLGGLASGMIVAFLYAQLLRVRGP